VTFSASRLTLYSLLSSLEEDLRKLVVSNLDGHLPAEELLTKPVVKACFERMEIEFGDRLENPSLVN